MRDKLFILLTIAAFLQMFAPVRFSGARAADASCDRACLTAITDQYLAAMVAHDSSHLPLAKNVKFTEDGVRLDVGDGLWATIGGLGSYKLYFDDPGGGGAGVIAVVQENGSPAIFELRLKVVKHQITEIETLVARKETTSLFKPEGLTEPRPAFLETVDPADRP